MRLELVDHAGELVDHARVGVGGLEAVETDEQRLVAAGLAGDGDRAPALVEGLAEPQVVRRQHREAAAEVGLGHAVPERRGPPQSAAEVRDALGGRDAQRDRHVAAEVAQHRHLEAPVAGLPGRLRGTPQIGPRLLVTLEALAGAGAREEHPADDLEVGDALGRGERPVVQRLGVAHRAPPRGGLAREEQGARGPRPVLGRRGVGPDRLRGRGQQVGRAPVVQAAHGRGRAGVEHLVHAGRSRTRTPPRPGPAGGRGRPARTGGRSPAPGAPAGPRPPRGRPSPRGRRRPAAAPRPPARGAGRARAPRPGGSRARPPRRSRARAGSRRRTAGARGYGGGSSGPGRDARPGRRARRRRRGRVGRGRGARRRRRGAPTPSRPPRRAPSRTRGAGRPRDAGRGSAAARRWPGRRCAGRRPRAAGARSR